MSTKGIKRTKIGQKKHDEAVLRTANWHKNKGYSVTADLPKWEKPKTIEGFIPDVIAKKGREEKVIEIETKTSNKKEIEQQEAFRSYVLKSDKRKFIKKII